MKISLGRSRSRERNFLERIARELFKKGDGRIAFLAFFDWLVGECWRLKKKEFFVPYFLRVFSERSSLTRNHHRPDLTECEFPIRDRGPPCFRAVIVGSLTEISRDWRNVIGQIFK